MSDDKEEFMWALPRIAQVSVGLARDAINDVRTKAQEERETFLAEHDENVRLHTELEALKERVDELSKCPNEAWECARIQKRLEQKLAALEAENASLVAALKDADKGLSLCEGLVPSNLMCTEAFGYRLVPPYRKRIAERLAASRSTSGGEND